MPTIELSQEMTLQPPIGTGVSATSELPLRLVLAQLPPGSFDIVDEHGVTVAKLEKLSPNLPALIREQLSAKDWEELRREMQEPRVLSSFEEVRQRVFV